MRSLQLVAGVAVSLWATSGASADVRTRVLAMTGQPAAGFPNGALIGSFSTTWQRPVLNDLGHVVFTGAAVGPGITSLNDTAVWLADSSGLTLLVREDDPVPGLTDVRVSFWTVVGLSNADDVFLRVQFRGNVTGINDSALCRVRPGEPLVIIAREGDPVSEDPADGTWTLIFGDQTTLPSVNGPGQAAVFAATTLH